MLSYSKKPSSFSNNPKIAHSSQGPCMACGGGMCKMAGGGDIHKMETGVHTPIEKGSGVSHSGAGLRLNGVEPIRVHQNKLRDLKEMPNPKLKGLAEGGSVDEAPDMADMAADELCSALESKDKKQIVSSIRALIASCMNDEGSDD